MGGKKYLIPILQFLTVSYHMSMLTTVIAHNPSRTRPSSVTLWATVSVSWLS